MRCILGIMYFVMIGMIWLADEQNELVHLQMPFEDHGCNPAYACGSTEKSSGSPFPFSFSSQTHVVPVGHFL